jgi:hypothetical protein
MSVGDDKPLLFKDRERLNKPLVNFETNRLSPGRAQATGVTGTSGNGFTLIASTSVTVDSELIDEVASWDRNELFFGRTFKRVNRDDHWFRGDGVLRGGEEVGVGGVSTSTIS